MNLFIKLGKNIKERKEKVFDNELGTEKRNILKKLWRKKKEKENNRKIIEKGLEIRISGDE